MSVENENQYQDLILENIQNSDIREFSFSEDVLDEIIKTDPTQHSLFCNESGISGSDPSTGIIKLDFWGNIKMEGKLHFNRYGIYFSLFAEVESIPSGFAELTIDLVPVYYKIRCGNVVGPYSVFGHGSGSTFSYKKNQSYQGSKSLNKVYFREKFHGKVNQSNGSTTTKSSEWIEIRVNY